MSMIGKTLGNFQCTALLGKGGMGEVYKAKDQKLGRDVAIKVLPEEFAKDADRVARFQREAKLLASLNHPNIASIYGLEESEGAHFLVLELVEGDTLADRIKSGAIPVEESLKLALQIAEALEGAHEKGVIHRDLKPANIKVTPDGKVKVLDFGLAKAFTGEPQANLSNSPTLSQAATMQGVILGTAAYMSPEQARGKPVDKRTDIWAFGCVLYEMLTGKAAFQGEDVTEILAAVVKLDANMKLLPANIHPRVRELLTRCLQKDAKRRYSGISDVQYDIEQVLADPAGLFAQTAATTKPRKKLRLGISWVAAALILGLIIAGVSVWYLKPSGPRQVHRFDYHLPEGQEFSRLGREVVAVSPDGTKIVCVANKQLYLKNSDELTARPIQGTNEDPANPFFSPDGQWIGFFDLTNKQLKKIAVNGGSPVMLCGVNEPFGASWGTDGMIVFGELGGVMRVSANGGTPEAIVKGEDNQLCFSPQMLPDGKSVLFSFLGQSGLQVAVQSLGSGERKDLFPGGPARYVSTGHIVYGLENSLYAVPFDCGTLKVKGGQVPLVGSVFRAASELPIQSALSESGTLAYLPGGTLAGGGTSSTLVWVDRQGKEVPLGTDPKVYRAPRISPDGTKVALAIVNGNKSDIWIWDVVRGNMMRLTQNETGDAPLWTLDGKRIAFAAGIKDEAAVYWRAASGTGSDELLASVPGQATVPWAWSADGKTLATIDYLGGMNFNIGSLSMEGDHAHKSLLHEEYIELQPEISPYGRWMAYSSSESGEMEIYVRPFPDIDKGKSPVSTAGGDSPLWSPDGKELFYRKNDEVVAVSIETEPTFKAGKPETLFRGNYVGLNITDAHPWDISPDGRRFLMMKPAGASASETPIPRKIDIVLNWFEELKEKVTAE